MSPEVSERAFEQAIECGLLQHGPDACRGYAPEVDEVVLPWGDSPPGGYLRRTPEEYDRGLCLLPREIQQNIDMESHKVQQTGGRLAALIGATFTDLTVAPGDRSESTGRSLTGVESVASSEPLDSPRHRLW